jgi:hypothetical protein
MIARSRLLLLPAILAMASGPVFADTKPALTVQVVETKDQDAYVAMIAKANTLIKARTGIERLRHVWVGDFAGENSHRVYVVSQYPSAADIYKFEAKMKDYPEVDTLMEQFKQVRHLGPSYLLKAVRIDGMYEGGAVLNTDIACTNEAEYLKVLDDLRAIFDANGFKDAKINLWRETAGRTTATHLVVISLPSQARVAELLDAISDLGLLKDWYVSAARFRTSLSNGTYHEITK